MKEDTSKTFTMEIKPIELEFTQEELTSKMQTIIDELEDYNLENQTGSFRAGFNTALRIVIYNLYQK